MTATTGKTTPMPAASSLKERLEAIRSRVAAAAERCGRAADKVVLVAVTKNACIDDIRELIRLGHTDLGENRVTNLLQRAALTEEYLQRHRELSSPDHVVLPETVRWHMIGHLQRNKVRKMTGLVRLIHSVDSLRLAEEIQTCAGRLKDPIEVLVQVNVAREKSKYGIAPAAARHLIEQIDTMIGIRPRGLMCMAPVVEDPEENRDVYERCRELHEEIHKAGVGGDRFDILSMGMTQDFEVAIECGANIVRVGTAIFGPSAADEQD